MASVRVATGRYSDSFDFGIHNGRVVQLAKCWSFQLPGQEALAEEIKAWAWVVEHLKNNGGKATAGARVYEIPARGDLDVAVVYVPPVRADLAIAFDQARVAFADLKVTAVADHQAEQVAYVRPVILPEARAYSCTTTWDDVSAGTYVLQEDRFTSATCKGPWSATLSNVIP